MKKLVLLVLVGLLTLSPSMASAASASGSAVGTPLYWHWASGTERSAPIIFVTNITSSSINVTLTIYDEDGSILTDTDDDPLDGPLRATGATLTNYDDSRSADGDSVTFTLAANDTARFRVIEYNTSDYHSGYVRIEWAQDSDAVVGLIASIDHETHGSDGEGHLTGVINAGLPF
ncbi:MAG: hypothetical protein AB7S78_09185 [Candidatus Omnitrophota bacterium]